MFVHNDYVERMRAHFGNGSMAEINSLSSYARELSTQDRKFYFNKLTLTNGVRLQDPCTINERVEDVSNWPNIQWPDIYTDLREKLRAY